MNDMSFTGKELLVELIDTACRQPDPNDTVQILREGLARSIAARGMATAWWR